jgi:hypothetical protein
MAAVLFVSNTTAKISVPLLMPENPCAVRDVDLLPVAKFFVPEELPRAYVERDENVESPPASRIA